MAYSSLTETSAVTTITVKANSQVHPESVPSDGQHVTFPSHFKVSEAVKNGLTFGSFDICFGSVTEEFNCTVGEINSMTPAESSSATDEAYGEPSPRLVNLLPCIWADVALSLFYCFLIVLNDRNLVSKFSNNALKISSHINAFSSKIGYI